MNELNITKNSPYMRAIAWTTAIFLLGLTLLLWVGWRNGTLFFSEDEVLPHMTTKTLEEVMASLTSNSAQGEKVPTEVIKSLTAPQSSKTNVSPEVLNSLSSSK